jgi:hypothetical protein
MLGCDITFLILWFQSNFDDNMNWANHGVYWHVDHITPCASFNFLNQDDINSCFHWSNLRPCIANDNLKKSSNIDIEIITEYMNRAVIFKNVMSNHETLITTLKEKFLRGSRLMAEPDSNNIRELMPIRMVTT